MGFSGLSAQVGADKHIFAVPVLRLVNPIASQVCGWNCAAAGYGWAAKSTTAEPRSVCVDLVWIILTSVFPLTLSSVTPVQVAGGPDRRVEKGRGTVSSTP